MRLSPRTPHSPDPCAGPSTIAGSAWRRLARRPQLPPSRADQNAAERDQHHGSQRGHRLGHRHRRGVDDLNQGRAGAVDEQIQEDGLALDLPLGHGGLLTLNVTRGARGYCVAERTSLSLLGAHARAQWRHLRAEQRWRGALARTAPSALDTLSAREREVLGWVADRHSNGEIATLLGSRAGTVKCHLENVYGKLGVSGRRDAANLLAPLLPRKDRREE